MPAKKKGKGGRPTKLTDTIREQAEKLALLGLTNAQMANVWGVATSTVEKWLAEDNEFSGSITRGKDAADAEIAQALWHRAKGYSHKEDKIFCSEGVPVVVPTTKHYPPDTQAASLWLRNRQPEIWRDKQDHDHNHKVDDLGTLIDTIRSGNG